LEAATQDLSESSYDGRELTLLTSDVASHDLVSQVIQSHLGRLGIRTRIEKVDLNTLISRLFGNERPELFLAFSEWVYSAPELIIDSFRSTSFPNPNLTGYGNAEVDSLLAGLPELRDRTKINSVCRKCAGIANDEAAAVWLYHIRSALLIRSGIDGLEINGHQHWNLKDVVVDERAQ
jgi:ABC-type transport system substrate-binding protein